MEDKLSKKKTSSLSPGGSFFSISLCSQSQHPSSGSSTHECIHTSAFLDLHLWFCFARTEIMTLKRSYMDQSSPISRQKKLLLKCRSKFLHYIFFSQINDLKTNPTVQKLLLILQQGLRVKFSKGSHLMWWRNDVNSTVSFRNAAF